MSLKLKSYSKALSRWYCIARNSV